MNRQLTLLVALFLSLNLNAQLDFTHWLPPMHSRDAGQIQDHYLYLSTPEAGPFTVTLTDGSGNVLATPEIAAGAPFIYEIADNDPSVAMIADGDLNQVLTNRGIIASADQKFYCNFRARSGVQATSITCKGNAARGTTFRVGSMPQQGEHGFRNFLVAIMATANGTTVNLSDYDADVEFFDVAGNVLLDELNFVLDSGECYVVSGYTDVPANRQGIVGALITSDKPIVVNNGNWCGSIADGGGQDIGMDQSVPITVLGTEYILIRGDGDAQMERPLIIAHTDNTEIFVNGLPEPVATIDAGDYFLIPELYYTGGGHENMSVKTNVPAYVYQPLGGTTDRATPGLNFIPPISCSLTKEIDMIPNIDQIGDVNYNGAIICFTIAGATVSVNGIPQGGAEPVDGAPEWETYKITGFTGDVTITSTDRMAAGMFGFNGLAGFAGFYSGFDQIGFVDFAFEEDCESFPVEFSDETVTFSEEVIAWDWSFGDGEISTDQNPSHLYADGGAYNVFLEITTNLGCTDTITQLVDVGFSPEAAFDFTNVCAYDSAGFSDLSTYIEGDITDFSWDFGDATTSIIPNPTHYYAASGTYPVSLSVTGDNGCIDIITDSIHIHPAPVVDFSAPNDCFYNTTDFENGTTIATGDIASYNWNFGDGTPISTEENPIHLFDAAGMYNVALTAISDQGCEGEALIELTRFAAPVAGFEFTDICIYDTENFVNTSTIDAPYLIASSTWDLGDGTLSLVDSPLHDYLAPGSYPVKLVTTTEEGCQDSLTHTVQIFAEPVVDFYVVADCYYNAASFENYSSVSDGEISSYSWDFNDGATSAEESPEHEYLAGGTYDVLLAVVSENGCESDTTITIERFMAPVADFTATNVCLYDSLMFDNLSEIEAPGTISSYHWDFGDDDTVCVVSPSHLYDSAGNYAVKLTAISEDGCIDETTIEVMAYPIPTAAFSAAAVCLGAAPSNFINTSSVEMGEISDWDWTFSDGSTSELASPEKLFATSGEHLISLVATSEFGCMDSTSNLITIHNLPVAIFTTADTVICGNECIDLNSSSYSIDAPLAYLDWSTSSDQYGSGPTVELCFENFDFVDSYVDVQLIVEDENGCKDTALAIDYLNILPTPEASFTINPDEINLLNTEVNFNNTSIYASEFTWDFGDGSANSNAINPIHLYEVTPGTHVVTLYAYSDPEYNCVDTAQQVITISDELIYYIPNAFTPNGNEHNNIFSPVFTSGYDPYSYHLAIYNRWGEVIFESFDTNVGWDGTYGGNDMSQDGVYIWKIEFKENLTGRTVQDVGHVTLLQ